MASAFHSVQHNQRAPTQSCAMLQSHKFRNLSQPGTASVSLQVHVCRLAQLLHLKILAPAPHILQDAES